LVVGCTFHRNGRVMPGHLVFGVGWAHQRFKERTVCHDENRCTLRRSFGRGIDCPRRASGNGADVLTAHRLSAALAAEAVAAAVASCAKQGYKVTAAIVDDDGVVQAMLRGDGASMTTPKAARDKAYTVLMLGGSRNEDASSAIVQRIGNPPSAGGLAKLPHI